MHEDIYDFDKTLVPGHIMVLNKTPQTKNFSQVLANVYYKKPKEIWCLSQACYEEVNYPNKLLLTTEELDERLECLYYQRPKCLIGVTGSYGKTSTCFFLYQLIKKSGYKVCMKSSMGYLNHDSPMEDINKNTSSLSTPGYIDLKRFLHHNHKCDFAILEVSSAAIAQKRIRGLRFDTGILTGLSIDHLDTHNSLEEYFQTKLSFFNSIKGPKCYHRQVYNKIAQPLEGVSYAVDSINVDSYISTNYQKTNVIGALTLLKELNITVPIYQLLEPKGRMEYVGTTNKGAEVYIDGAHAAEQVGLMLQTIDTDCLIIYGASGKRLATDLSTADILMKFPKVIITDDSPRPYESSEILYKLRRAHFVMIPNRFEAIKKGLSEYKVKNIYILGKGSEVINSIEYKTHTIYYKESEVVQYLLRDSNPHYCLEKTES